MGSTGVLRSMTGFGRAQGEQGAVAVEIEVKSVNHRYTDISCKMPRQYSAFEIPIRTLISQHISRGKIEVLINRKKIDDQTSAEEVTLNRGLYESYLRVYRERLAEIGSGVNPQAFERYIGEILAKPGVIDTSSEVSVHTEEEISLVTKVLEIAIQALIKMREIEGEEILKDLVARLENVSIIRGRIQALAEQTPLRLKERLIDRLKKLTPEIQLDEGRVLLEASMFADRADITEELVRLEAHIGAFAAALKEKNSGKRLDFLVQEIGREFNTIGSKSQHAEISHDVVGAKVELEKIREQLQNVE